MLFEKQADEELVKRSLMIIEDKILSVSSLLHPLNLQSVLDLDIRIEQAENDIFNYRVSSFYPLFLFGSCFFHKESLALREFIKNY